MNQLEESKEQNELLEFRMYELEKTYEDAEEQLKKRQDHLDQEVFSKLSSFLRDVGLTHLLYEDVHQSNGQSKGEDDNHLGGHINVSTPSLV
jgi:hypothetical protein